MIGQKLGGYRVIEQLGTGGMGVVYVGQHELIGKRAAIKVLLPALSRDEAVVRRFFNEARAATQVRHPGIIEVFDFGHAADGSAYIVMELLHGETLTARVHRHGRLPMTTSIRFVQQIAGALGAAHAAGIVHRDLKPENVFIVQDPDVTGGERAKVLDFGIAKLAGDMSAEELKTRTGAVFGTPRYMAPEQCRGAGEVDHRADLYALGCIFYEMLCGRPPFLEKGIGELFAAHMFIPPQPPSTFEPSVPPALEAVMLGLLAKAPEQRFPSAAAFLQALEQAAIAGQVPGERGPSVVDVPPARRATGQPTTTLGGSVGTVHMAPPAASRRSRWPWLAVAGLAIASGVGIVLVMAEDGRPTTVSSVAAIPAGSRGSQEIADASTKGEPVDGGTGWGTIGAGNPGSMDAGESGYRSSPPEVDIGNKVATGELDKNVIRRYIRRKLPRITSCYEEQLRVREDLSGTVVAQFQIDPQGVVIESQAEGMSKEVADCVAKVIQSIQFPKPKGGGVVQVRYPFTFRPTGR